MIGLVKETIKAYKQGGRRGGVRPGKCCLP